MADYIKQIEDQLVRLQVSVNDDPTSGLMVRPCFNEYDIEYTDIVDLYDDYAEGVYDVTKLINILSTLTKSSLDSVADDNIWQQIQDAEIEAI